ncbi:SHOCT domain-containing protein [Hymenobacter sp. BT186]|uniref:SHOCT domain-containing protein n=1 Tax=Hymenobacter telluris TaxID=2816474 RepID=A0A939EV57_9BACT|nr:SHOCT domain-containing protein [Hymenobacter telluris]MBO0357245.1 SHOCT domain-containing protein [Hymenobacter telluris]MBW3373271.1 SHOCT domain-containing protein [Hymenobacter norwichensis]
MEKSSSPLDNLLQLRELLDAGLITPQEFETLKSRLLASPTAPLTPPAPTPEVPVAPQPSPFAPENVEPTTPEPAPANPTEWPRPAAAPTPEYTPFSPPIEPQAPVGQEVAPDSDVVEQEEVFEEPPRNPLGKILAIGGGVLLLGLILYLLLGQSRSSEHLTSISQTAADTVAVTPETGPQAEQLDLPPVAAPETVRVAPAVPLTPDSATATAPPDASGQPTTTEPTPAADNPDEAAARINKVLAAYYSDLQAAPFSAEQYFAPQVELFIILRNTTPAAINAWLDQNRFNEFKDAQTQVEPGTLRVTPVAADGSRTATYIERSRAFRQSLQKNQNTRAQMRLRVNSDYKIVYQKQERLLENTLTDVEGAAQPAAE